jgi:hypothetical protein
MLLNTKTTSLFKDQDKYVVVPADKAPNNIVLICKNIILAA